MKQHYFMLAPKRNLFGSLVALLLALGILSVISPYFSGSAYAHSTPSEPDDAPDASEPEEDPDCEPPGANDGPQGGGKPCPSEDDSTSETSGEDPMTVWRVSEPYINLWLEDTPVRYRMGSGQWMKFKITYKQRGDARDPRIAGFGPNWQCNWIGMVDTGSSGYVTNYVAGGGMRIHPNDVREAISGSVFTSLTVGSASSVQSSSGLLSALSANSGGGGGAVRHFPRHTRLEYTRQVDFADRTTQLLSKKIDPYGRFINYGWVNETVNGQSIWRLMKVADKDGRECTLSYTNTSFPALITAVSDPYGRTARFFYDGAGRLKRIEDPIGIWSEFTYDGTSGIVTNLNTPYGNTGFKYFEGSVGAYDLNRAIEVTEANGDKQLYAYRDCGHIGTQGAGGIYASDDAGIDDRNSYHWNRQQYQQISEQGRANYLDMPVEDYWKASLKHWLLNGLSTTKVSEFCGAAAGPVLDATEGPVRCNQVFFQYHGQTTPTTSGTLKRMVLVVRNGTSYVEGVSAAEAYEYNAWGRPTTITHYNNGSPITYNQYYDDDGRRLLRVVGPRGELTRGYGYHPVTTNLLTSVTNAENQVIRYTHSPSNIRVTSITYPSGLVVSNAYYSTGEWSGFLQMQVEVGFATNHYAYTNGNVYIHTNELRLITTNIYDALNRLVAKHYPNGYRSNHWDRLDLVGVRDRLGNWKRYSFDHVRRLVSITNENQQVTAFRYCGCGSPEQIERYADGKTNRTTYVHDLAGRRSLALYPDGFQRTYLYDAQKHLKKVSDNSGYLVEFGYDDLDNLTTTDVGRVGGALLRWETRDYDEYGRTLRIVDRNGVMITNSFDYVGRVLERHIEGAGTEFFGYSDCGLTNYVDPLGENTAFVLDVRSQVLFQTNANHEVLGFTYDPAGSLTTLRNGKHQVTLWHYDQYGRVTNKINQANQESYRFTYDPEGQLTNRWQIGGIVKTYMFDPVGNLTSVVYSGGATTPQVVFRYDGLNRLTNIVDGIGSSTFGWTDGNQLAYEDGPWVNDRVDYLYSAQMRSGLALQQEKASDWLQSYAYDETRRLTNVVSPAGIFEIQYKEIFWNGVATACYLPEYLRLPGGTQIQNEYDGLGRLLSTVLKNQQMSALNAHSYSYDDGQHRLRQTFKDGNYVDYEYDGIGQIVGAYGRELDGAPRAHEWFGYGYDAGSNLSFRTNNSLIQTYGVNSLDQLTNLSRTGNLTVAGAVSTQPVSLTVKDNGNAEQPAIGYSDNTFARPNVPLLSGSNTFQAVVQDGYGRRDTNQITVWLPVSSSCYYDVRGNMTNDGQRVFYYDAENQLVTVLASNLWRSDFLYDGLMRRRIRLESVWQGDRWITNQAVHYSYDNRLVLQERHYSLSGTSFIPLETISYTRANDLSGTLQGAGGAGGLLARTETGTLGLPHSYYHSDGNGNITALVASDGNVVARYHYDPYGNVLALTGPLAEANLYRFSSREWHENSRLIYYLYRYYEPNLQRWISQDPVGELGGINLYQFVSGCPIGRIDLWGEKDRCFNPFDPQFWSDLLGGGKEGKPADPDSNLGLRSEYDAGVDPITDENGEKISGGQCAGLICGAIAAGLLDAMTDGIGGRAGKAEDVGCEVVKRLRKGNFLKDEKEVFKHLDLNHGITPELASDRLHDIKHRNGFRGGDNVVFDYTGNVYNPHTGEHMGSLTAGGAKRK